MGPGDLPDGAIVDLESHWVFLLAIFQRRDLEESIAVARGEARAIEVELAIVDVVLMVGLDQFDLRILLDAGLLALRGCELGVHHSC